MISDVPYGAFLSGGIDSSTIVGLMSLQLGRPVSTFSVGYEGDGEALSELSYAKLVAERYATDHHEVLIGGHDFVQFAEKVVWHLDQPLADDACLPNLMVSQLAQQHVKMVLTGEGGDELFAGYTRYAAELRLGPIAGHVPSAIQRLMRAAASRRPGVSRSQLAVYALAEPSEASRLSLYTPLMLPETRERLITPLMQAAVSRVRTNDLFENDLHRTDATCRLHRMLYVDAQHWLPDYLLLRGDKTSMAESLEARVPLLDHPLVEYAATLPPQLKIHGVRQSRKYLLREAARDLLPPPILSRSKKGFPVPISQWLRGAAREFCHDLLAADVVRRRGLFDQTAVTALLRQHDSRAADHGSLLWGLMSVELWHRQYIDRAHGVRMRRVRAERSTHRGAIVVRIGIDARPATEIAGGIGTYVRELITEISVLAGRQNLLLYARESWDGMPPRDNTTWQLYDGHDISWSVRAAIHANRACDVFLATNGYFLPWFLTIPSVVCVHDLVSFDSSRAPNRRFSLIERSTIRPAVRRARTIVTISESTRRDLINLFPHTAAKAQVILDAAESRFSPARTANDHEVLLKHGLDRPYVLAVGTLEPRKNLIRLIEAFSMLPDDVLGAYRLVLVGAKGWDADGTLSAINRHTSTVRALGYVPDVELPPLYRGATLLAFPSVYEGFGFPVLEAMQSGTPVLASSTSSIPEVGGDAVRYVDPFSVDDIRRGLCHLLRNDQERAELSRRGLERSRQFSWSATAAATFACLEDAAAGGKRE